MIKRLWIYIVKKVLTWLADKQYVGSELFPYLMGVKPNAALELARVVFHQKEWWIHLNQRPIDDPDYPGQPWHSSGKVLVKGIRHDELIKKLALPDESGLPVGEVVFAGAREFPNDPRGAGKIIPGHWVCLIFVEILPSMPEPSACTGKFFPISQVEGLNLINSHRLGILPAVEEYLQTGTPSYKEVIQ